MTTNKVFKYFAAILLLIFLIALLPSIRLANSFADEEYLEKHGACFSYVNDFYDRIVLGNKPEVIMYIGDFSRFRSIINQPRILKIFSSYSIQSVELSTKEEGPDKWAVYEFLINLGIEMN